MADGANAQTSPPNQVAVPPHQQADQAPFGGHTCHRSAKRGLPAFDKALPRCHNRRATGTLHHRGSGLLLMLRGESHAFLAEVADRVCRQALSLPVRFPLNLRHDRGADENSRRGPHEQGNRWRIITFSRCWLSYWLRPGLIFEGNFVTAMVRIHSSRSRSTFMARTRSRQEETLRRRSSRPS